MGFMANGSQACLEETWVHHINMFYGEQFRGYHPEQKQTTNFAALMFAK